LKVKLAVDQGRRTLGDGTWHTVLVILEDRHCRLSASRNRPAAVEHIELYLDCAARTGVRGEWRSASPALVVNRFIETLELIAVSDDVEAAVEHVTHGVRCRHSRPGCAAWQNRTLGRVVAKGRLATGAST